MLPDILPAIPTWAQQLASILPLSALADFADVSFKLHIYQLSGSIPLWNWPITPVGARMVLANDDIEESCCLDSPGRSPILECLDGRHGDWYPSSNPTTTRLWCSTEATKYVVKNENKNMKHPNSRPQKLEIFRLINRKNPARKVTAKIRNYTLTSLLGWTGWLAFCILSLLSRSGIGAAYLILLPLTGLIIRHLHGGSPRHLLSGNTREERLRLIIATSSLNATKWWAFYGDSTSSNCLLNRPLLQRTPHSKKGLLRYLLQIVILGQWALVLASCALQDWNAFIISIWIAFCILTSSYVYPPEWAVRDWLRDTCNVSIERIVANFSSRRAMLSALVYINPDTVERRTAWIDPVLSKSSPDRSEWETALLAYIEDEDAEGQPVDKRWWTWIVEGVQMGKKIKPLLEIQSNHPATETST